MLLASCQLPLHVELGYTLLTELLQHARSATDEGLCCFCVQGTDELISSSPHDMPRFSARIGALAAFTRSHPETLMLDPIERVEQVSLLAHLDGVRLSVDRTLLQIH